MYALCEVTRNGNIIPRRQYFSRSDAKFLGIIWINTCPIFIYLFIYLKSYLDISLIKIFLFIYIFIFPSYSTVCVKVILSALMRMRRLIWLHWSQRSYCPKSVFQISAFRSPKIRSIPLFQPMLPCSLNIFGCSLGPKITPVAPFIVRARNMGLNKAPYANVPDSLA